MKTVGQILKEARLEKNISLDEAARTTRIRLNHLEALENDSFFELPSLTSTQGFIKNYAEYLNLPTAGTLAVFRRDYSQSEKGKIIPQGMVEPLSREGWRVRPKVTLLFGMVLLLISLIFYLGYQYFSLNNNPPLEVTSPQEKETVFTNKIEVVGHTRPDVTVTVNGNLCMLSSQGEFRYILELFPGENLYTVVAKSKLGKATKKEGVVYRFDAER